METKVKEDKRKVESYLVEILAGVIVGIMAVPQGECGSPVNSFCKGD